MQQLIALCLPLFAGTFFLFGFLFVRLVKNKQQLSILSVSMAFIVMIGIVFLDLLPEIIESMQIYNFASGQRLLFLILIIGMGILLLKILDFFVPSHKHEHHDHEKNNEEHESHMEHIGIVTTFSLILHNIIEGLSIYVIACENLSAGLLLSVAVGLHNFPLGIEIATGLEGHNEKLKRLLMFALICSSFLGVLFFALSQIPIHGIVILILMCLSLGMILYIALFELLKEIFAYRNKKSTIYGMLLGIFILVIMNFLG